MDDKVMDALIQMRGAQIALMRECSSFVDGCSTYDLRAIDDLIERAAECRKHTVAVEEAFRQDRALQVMQRGRPINLPVRG